MPVRGAQSKMYNGVQYDYVFDVELEVVPFAQAQNACSMETAGGQAAAVVGRQRQPFRA